MYWVPQKKDTKLIKRNLKLIIVIIICNWFQIPHNLSQNFKPLFVGIHQVLREIWLFEHKFQARNFGQL